MIDSLTNAIAAFLMFLGLAAPMAPNLGATILFPTGGGTGWGNIQQGRVIYGNGTDRLATTTGETLGYVLQYDGVKPIWVSTTTLGISGTITGGGTIGQLAYFTSPTALSSVATGTVSSGAGISVTAGQSVIGSGLTVTNTGVTSVIAGTGISVSGATGNVTISATGGSGNVATSSTETSTYVPFWTTTGATPAALSGGESTFTYDATLNKLTVENASTTRFSSFTESKFGSTATSSFNSAGVLSLATALTVPNGGTGQTSFTSGNLIYGSGSGALQNVATNTPTVTYPVQYSGTGAIIGSGTFSLAFGTTTNNTWSGLQQFTAASTTRLSCYGPCYFGATATSSFSTAGALTLVTPLLVSSGGTGQNTFTSGNLLYGSGTNGIQNVATTSVTCSGSTTCTSFTAIGGSPITISSTAAADNIATSSAETSTFVPFWTSTNATPALLSGGENTFTYDSTLNRLLIQNASSTRLSVFTEAKFGATATSSFSSTGVLSLASALTVANGGTGQTTLTSGNLLYGSGANGIQSVATTSVSCSGTVSCSAFTAIGAAPITITGSGGGSSSIATSSAETSTYIPFWTSTGATPALLSGGENTFTYDSTLNRLLVENASSTRLTVLTEAKFGSTATSTFNAAGALTLAGAPTGPLQAIAGLVSASTTLSTAYGGTGANTLTGLIQGNGSGALTGVTGSIGEIPYFNGTNTLLATSTIYIDTQSEVGISSTTPTAKFAINTFDPSTADIFKVSTTSAAGSNNTIFNMNYLGGVGIGTTTPSATFRGLLVTPALVVRRDNGQNLGAIYQGNGGSLDLYSGSTVNIRLDANGEMWFRPSGSVVFGTNGTCGTNGKACVYGGTSIGQSFLGVEIPKNGLSVEGGVAVGTTTTTNLAQMTIATSSSNSIFKGQLALTDNSAGAGFKHLLSTYENGFFYMSTTTDGYATSSSPVISFDRNGNFGVATSVPASRFSVDKTVNISANATSTFYSLGGGINISSGCYAVNGVCLSTGGGSGTPGGSGTELQYRAGASTFGGITGSAFDSSAVTTGFGTTSPWAVLSVANATYDYTRPLFFVATSTDQTGNLFSITATTTIMNTISTTDTFRGNDTGSRVVVGRTGHTGYPGPLDQLEVDGRISTGYWAQYNCQGGSMISNSLAVDTNNLCGGWSFQEDGTATVIGSASSGQQDIQLAIGDTTNNGAGLFVGSAPILFASTTPVMEVVGRTNNANGASSTAVYIGFTNVNSAGTSFETPPTIGCYFTASSTTMNWQALCRSSAAAVTQIDTGVASSTGTSGLSRYVRFRLEMDNVSTRFYIGDRVISFRKIAEITTNRPAVTNVLIPGVYYASVDGGTNRNWSVSSAILWLYNDMLKFI